MNLSTRLGKRERLCLTNTIARKLQVSACTRTCVCVCVSHYICPLELQVTCECFSVFACMSALCLCMHVWECVVPMYTWVSTLYLRMYMRCTYVCMSECVVPMYVRVVPMYLCWTSSLQDARGIQPVPRGNRKHVKGCAK